MIQEGIVMIIVLGDWFILWHTVTCIMWLACKHVWMPRYDHHACDRTSTSLLRSTYVYTYHMIVRRISINKKFMNFSVSIGWKQSFEFSRNAQGVDKTVTVGGNICTTVYSWSSVERFQQFVTVDRHSLVPSTATWLSNFPCEERFWESRFRVWVNVLLELVLRCHGNRGKRF